MSKVTAQDILEALEEGGWQTKAALAELFGVHPETIEKKLKQLREAGEALVHGSRGLNLTQNLDLENDPAAANDMFVFIKWVLNSQVALATCTTPNKTYLPALKRALKKSLTSHERKALGRTCLRIKYIADAIDESDED